MHGLKRLEMVEAKQIEFLMDECHEWPIKRCYTDNYMKAYMRVLLGLLKFSRLWVWETLLCSTWYLYMDYKI